MGAEPRHVTMLHHAEYLADVPDTRRVRRHRLVTGPDGRAWWSSSASTTRTGSSTTQRQPSEDYFAIILREYLATHPHEHGRVGAAESQLIDAAGLVRFGASWMTAHLR